MNKPQQQQPESKVKISQQAEEIIKFINNPIIEKIPDIVGYLQQLSNIKYDLLIEYQSSLYCALSGKYFNENNQDDMIQHDGYYFLASEVREYYRRGEYYDISIGDLEFEYYNGYATISVIIELTQELIKKVFKNQFLELLKKSDAYYQNQEIPFEFICQKTKKKYYVSDKIRFNDQDVSIYWALENIHLLDQVQKQYVQSCQRMLSQILLRY